MQHITRTQGLYRVTAKRVVGSESEGEGQENWGLDVHAKARSYSNIHLSIASSTKTRSTSVNVCAICLNLGRKPFKAAKIRRRESGEILLPDGLGVAAKIRCQRMLLPSSEESQSSFVCLAMGMSRQNQDWTYRPYDPFSHL